MLWSGISEATVILFSNTSDFYKPIQLLEYKSDCNIWSVLHLQTLATRAQMSYSFSLQTETSVTFDFELLKKKKSPLLYCLLLLRPHATLYYWLPGFNNNEWLFFKVCVFICTDHWWGKIPSHSKGLLVTLSEWPLYYNLSRKWSKIQERQQHSGERQYYLSPFFRELQGFKLPANDWINPTKAMMFLSVSMAAVLGNCKSISSDAMSSHTLGLLGK